MSWTVSEVPDNLSSGGLFRWFGKGKSRLNHVIIVLQAETWCAVLYFTIIYIITWMLPMCAVEIKGGLPDSQRSVLSDADDPVRGAMNRLAT